MVSVKVLKPYYLKIDKNFVHVILDYQYFTVEIGSEVYQFIPVEAKQIKIDRRTQKIKNTYDILAFQKGRCIKYIPISELVAVPEFLIQLYTITSAYYLSDNAETDVDTDLLIAELERLNVMRLIDKSLDEQDEETFYKLLQML
ncbi:MAG TPA: IDEAL domain-containing protein [Bacillota bacterium]|nr:IDEAL domain-containing protein [Bacillota bacterium]